MTALKDRVRDEIPGYRAAQRRSDRLRAMLGTPAGTIDLDATYTKRISEAIDGGAENLDELRAAYVTDLQQVTAAAGFHTLMVRSHRQAYDAADAAERAGTDHALDFLRTELATLMEEVDEHRAVLASHPENAEAAINAGADGLDRWKIAEDLISRYAELRSEHRRYCMLQDGQPLHFATIGQCAGFLEADPYWARLRSTRGGSNSTDAAIAAWMSTQAGGEPHRNGIWPDTISRADWLLIVADNEPWLPDAGHIGELGHRCEQLFVVNRSYRNGLEISSFRDSMTRLTELGATTTFALESTAPQAKTAKTMGMVRNHRGRWELREQNA